jgi:hypothetical protein
VPLVALALVALALVALALVALALVALGFLVLPFVALRLVVLGLVGLPLLDGVLVLRVGFLGGMAGSSDCCRSGPSTASPLPGVCELRCHGERLSVS